MIPYSEGVEAQSTLARHDTGELRGASIFITGATGFFGRWLLELLAFANDAQNLQLTVHALSRDPRAFALRAPELAAHPMLRWVAGDVKDLRALPFSSLTHVFHLAAETDARLYAEDPVAETMTIVDGTRHVARLARVCGAARVLYASSGAVYGPQPTNVLHVSEDERLAPEPTSRSPGEAYGQAKRFAESVFCLEAARTGSPFSVSIARGFAFSGAHLPIDRHFAIGNFVRDAHARKPVIVGGDGTPLRSYLDASDLARWLVAMLVRGAPHRAYNVGSEEAVSIVDLAREAAAFTGSAVEVMGRPTGAMGEAPPSRYLPSTKRAESELGLGPTVSRHESLARMFRAADAGPR